MRGSPRGSGSGEKLAFPRGSQPSKRLARSKRYGSSAWKWTSSGKVISYLTEKRKKKHLQQRIKPYYGGNPLSGVTRTPA